MNCCEIFWKLKIFRIKFYFVSKSQCLSINYAMFIMNFINVDKCNGGIWYGPCLDEPEIFEYVNRHRFFNKSIKKVPLQYLNGTFNIPYCKSPFFQSLCFFFDSFSSKVYKSEWLHLQTNLKNKRKELFQQLRALKYIYLVLRAIQIIRDTFWCFSAPSPPPCVTFFYFWPKLLWYIRWFRKKGYFEALFFHVTKSFTSKSILNSV